MASAALEAHPRTTGATLGRSWRLLICARACVDGGCTRADLARDLGALASHRFTPGELRFILDRETASLAADGLATDARGRTTLTPEGQSAVFDALGIKATVRPLAALWPEIRDVRLVAFALGLEGEAATKVRQLARPDALRAAILQKAYKLNARSRTSPARLRTALATIALQRAFGNPMKEAIGAGSGLSAKAGRLLAGQLVAKPRDFGTDARLIAALAAEKAGSPQIDAEAVRLAVLRRLISEIGGSAARPAPVAEMPRPPRTEPLLEIQEAVSIKPPAASRPDLDGFASTIQSLARTVAEGWPGNRKAFISDVWQALKTSRPTWGLTEIEFKSMLAEAHRTGHVVLANADLKDRRTLPKLQQSAIAFKNSVLHFVRVAD